MSMSLSRLTPEIGLASYIREIKQYPVLSADEEYMLAVRVFEDQDIKAAHTLVTSHLRLVVKVAFKMRKFGMALMDLISEGNIGLMCAVKKFNPHVGCRLSTYALWWIKASIQEFIIKTCSLVKMGTTIAQKKLFFNLNKLKTQIQNFSSNASGVLSEADVSNISTQLNVSKDEVKEMDTRLSNCDLSLDAETNSPYEGQSSSLLSIIPDHRENHELTISNSQELANKRALFSEGMKLLNEREKDILISRRLKTNGDTLDVLSNKYKISRERVRQIEARAIEKLQSYCLPKLR